MNTVASKVAVVGSGISGAVCASTLAKHGVSVTLFDSARGPGGRMSRRRETCEDGKELLFDHGAPFFCATNNDVLNLVHDWESKGLVAEWKHSFGDFDFLSKGFLNIEQEQTAKRYVGVPGMNSICRALSNETGVESKFGVGVGKIEWLDDEKAWSLTSSGGQELGHFKGVVASDKNIVSSRYTEVTGFPPPLDLSFSPEFAAKLQDIPVNPCFSVMLAFAEPLSSIPVKGITFKNSDVLSWGYCDSSKPSRPSTSERWVLYSTAKYATSVIAETGLKKLSSEALDKVAEQVLSQFKSTGLHIPHPFFMKAHRCKVCLTASGYWFVHRGGAFPATSIAAEEKCLWNGERKVAICGDFCVSPNVEGAILSGMAAASKLSASFLSCSKC
ncbi:PSPTO_1126 [Linum perenne]